MSVIDDLKKIADAEHDEIKERIGEEQFAYFEGKAQKERKRLTVHYMEVAAHVTRPLVDSLIDNGHCEESSREELLTAIGLSMATVGMVAHIMGLDEGREEVKQKLTEQ